ncbi:MAG: ester cyclase, partial [Candidatus Dormibacteraeota bacterium]|nr:ester cyclase [Candidatus Dormibacteraeota bacterium]
MSENIKAIGGRIPMEVFGQGRYEVVDEIVSPDIVDHGTPPPGMPPGREGLKAIARAVRAAFPDLKSTVDLQVAEGDLVAGKITYTGTMKGDLFGMKATGKQATWTESHFVRIKNGKITEHWADIDQLGMLRQLGLAPAPPTTAGT